MRGGFNFPKICMKICLVDLLDILDWQYHGDKSRFLGDLLDFIWNFECFMICASYMRCGQRAIRDPDFRVAIAIFLFVRWLVGPHWYEVISVPALAKLLILCSWLGIWQDIFWKLNARNLRIIALRPKEFWEPKDLKIFGHFLRWGSLRRRGFALGTHHTAVCWRGSKWLLSTLLLRTLLCARN